MRRFLWLTTKGEWGKSRKEYLVPISEIKMIEKESDGTAIVTIQTGDILQVKEQFDALGQYLNERESLSIYRESDEE